jgi:hypothetical protein
MSEMPKSQNRYMTLAEYKLWDKRMCPHCKGTEWSMGARGGIMRNVQCTGCGMKLNVFDPKEFQSSLPGLCQVLHEPPGYKQPGKVTLKSFFSDMFGRRKEAKKKILGLENKNA